MDDFQTIDAVLNGDRDQYTFLVERYKKLVYAIAWSQLGSRDLSEDAAQETFVKAYSYLRTLRDPGRFPFWLGQIARNVCKRIRQSAYRENQSARRWAAEKSATLPAATYELNLSLWESFAKLPGSQREALTLFYVEDKSITESSLILGISESAMKVRLHRARTSLRLQLEAELENSLETLKPSKGFTNSVMGALPVSPLGMLSSGGVLAFAGKLVAVCSMALWMCFAQLGMLGAVMVWLFRDEAARLTNSPEDQYQKRLLQRQMKFRPLPVLGAVFAFLTVLFLAIAVQRIFRSNIDLQIYMMTLAIPLFVATGPTFRHLRVRRNARTVGLAIGLACMIIGYMAAGLRLVPFDMMYLSFIPLTVIPFFTAGESTGNKTYRLVTRAGTAAELPQAPAASTEFGPLTDDCLQSFAGFLGLQGLIHDYILTNGILYLLPGIGCNSMWPYFRNYLKGTTISIAGGGEIKTVIREEDWSSMELIINGPIDLQEMEKQVSRCVTTALAAYLEGDVTAARYILTGESDEPVSHRRPVTVPQVVAALLCTASLLWVYLSPHIGHYKGH